MKKLIGNEYANFYLNAADKLGVKYTILNEEIGLARIFDGENSLDISSNVIGVNSQLSSRLSGDKSKTSILLKEKNIPVPSFKIFTDPKKATIYALKKIQNKKSIVVKPTSSSFSLGITVNPKNLRQIKKAISEAFLVNSSIMIEEYIRGKHFRITVLDNEVIAITQRTGAYVIGNGKNTITELIRTKNDLRKKRKLPSISLRKKDLDYLKNEKIELQKIYPNGAYVMLQLGCDLEIGGERTRINKKNIPQENLDLFVRATKILNLRFSGIDYITPDIFTPYTKISSAINEINSAPHSNPHYKDTYPHDNYAAERIINKLFNLKTDIGGEHETTPLLSELDTSPIVNKDNIQIN